MSVIRSLVVLVVLVIVIPLGASFIRQGQAARQELTEQTRLQNLVRYTVGRGDVQRSVSALGTIETDSVVDLGFETSGLATEVLVKTGDYVRAGDPIARLASDTQKINYEQAKLALEKANNALADLLGPVDENDIKVAKANLASAQASYTSAASSSSDADVAQAQLRYEQAQHAFEEAKHKRQVSGGLNDDQYTLLDAQVGAASFNAEIARLQLAQVQTGNTGGMAQAGAQIALRQKQLDQLLAGPKQSVITNAQIALQQAEAQLRDAETALNRTTLYASIDGVVTSVNVDVGQPVLMGKPVIQITNMSALGLIAQVDEEDINLIKDGMPTYVELDALPSVELPASVKQIEIMGTEVNGVVSYDTHFTLKQVDPRVRVGMTGEAFVILETRQSVLTVPNNFLHVEADGRVFVDILDAKNKESRVEIKLGLQGADNSEVLSGLKEGDVVVVAQTASSGLPGGQSR
ncbi:MAG: efflux RND transporter periplasmic adaptor subunit [Anaerolineaceae bacterium]|nr:efflux RND transporter periplasmic adaptor subunit [Anaerolineaceae bacterium]